MKNEILFYNNVMKNGNSKGEINTFKKKIKYIVRNLIYYKYSKKLAQFIMNDEYLKDKIYNYICYSSCIGVRSVVLFQYGVKPAGCRHDAGYGKCCGCCKKRY